MRIPTIRFHNDDGTDFPTWKEVKLQEVCEIRGGGTPDTKNPKYWNGDIQWFTPTEVGHSKYVYSSERTISIAGLNNSSAKLLPSGTILLSTRATVGEMSIAKRECATNQGFQSLIEDQETIYNEYLYYLGEKIKKYCLVNASGSTFLEISKNNLGKMQIPLPSILEQKALVEFFSTVDEKIENQQAIIASLEKQKKGFMQRLFSQELRFKDENGEEYPEWQEVRLSECIECLDNQRIPVNSQTRSKMKGIYPYYGANGIQGYVDDYIFDGEYTLLAEDGGMYDDFREKPIAQFISGKCWVNNHAHVLKFSGCSKFLFYSLVHKDIRAYINGTSRSKLNQGDMMDIAIHLPTEDEQQKITFFLSTYDEKITIEQDILTHWQTIKKGLLQQMFV